MPETTSTPSETPNLPPTTTPPASPSPTSSAPTSTTQPNDAASLLSAATETAPAEPKPPAEPVGAPEAYADFKVPDGYTLDKAIVDEASPIFKELNLDQSGAQKLVDFYLKHNAATVKDAYDTFRAERTRWAGESTRWLEANGGLESAKQTLGRALNAVFAKADGTPDAEALDGFRHFMDSTGGGDNPFAVRAMVAMAKKFVEARPVEGAGPSPFGQKPPQPAATSLADRMYPNGPRTGPWNPNGGQPQGG